MSIRGSCALSIADEILDFALINNSLKITPTKIVRYGQQITSNRKAVFDIWSYEVDIIENGIPCDALEKILDVFKSVLTEILNLSKIYEIKLNLYLRSDYGQMGLELSPKIMDEIAKLGLGLDVHILSFGGVEE